MSIERKPLGLIKGPPLRIVYRDEDRVPYGFIGLARIDTGEVVAIVSEDDLYDAEHNNRFDMGEE